MSSNVETYYFYQDEQRISDIRLLTYEKTLDGIFEAVKKALDHYPSICKMKDSLYNYYVSECTDYANLDPDYEKEFAISKFIVMMNRVMSLELLFIQFPRSDDLKELERELELFMLICNIKINDSKMMRRQQILNPVKFYNERYAKYLLLFVDVSGEERDVNISNVKKFGYEYYF